jgi:sulfur-carrier protein adenylyltransferase/sulfurtransferase
MSLSKPESIRYSRHLALREIGLAGQEKLKAARVLVIGAGGLGSPSTLYLAAAGIGTLGIIDHDHIDVSNLQRQVLYDTESIAQPKAQAARRRLLALNPEIHIDAIDIELNASNVMQIFSEYDIVLDGTDRFTTRYLANDACVILKKPLVSAAIHRFEGQAMTYVPGRSPCYRCLFPDPPAEGLVPNCAEAGVLGVLPGVMGGIQATEAIKLIVGTGELLTGRLLTYDALGMRFAEFRFSRREDCAVCSANPSILEPRDLVQACTPQDMAAVKKVSATTLQAWLSRSLGDKPSPLIVDVREPHEFAISHLPNSINIPARELAGRIGELSSNRLTVFVCRSGSRSLTASGVAYRSGIAEPAHLQGGLLAWARDVDPGFEVAPV